MNHDIIIQNEGIILEALSELNSSYQNLCTIYSEIESILNKVKNDWYTTGLGGDAESYKASLAKNIELMRGQILPNFKQFNQVISSLIAQYRSQQQ